MIANDHALGKKGRGLIVLLMCPPIFLFVGVQLFLGALKFEGQDGGSVSLVYGMLSIACLLYSLYITYCLFTLTKTVRSIEYSAKELLLIDYAGRSFSYPTDSHASIEEAELGLFLGKFFVFQSTKDGTSAKANRIIKFNDGRNFLISARFESADTVLKKLLQTRDRSAPSNQ